MTESPEEMMGNLAGPGAPGRHGPIRLPAALGAVVLSTLVLCQGRPAEAAGHEEISIVPIGAYGIEAGKRELVFPLPRGARGVLNQPVVLLAAQPLVEVAVPLAPETQPAGERPKQQVPATIRFNIAGKNLPDWPLEKYSTGYVINLATLRANPDYAKGRLRMSVEVTTTAPRVGVTLLGMPDPLLLSDKLDGPWIEFFNRAEDAELKAYFDAQYREIGGDSVPAQEEYEKLKSSKNPRLARLARRSLRMLSYLHRRRKLSGNFMEHYRWALYLQQCALFAPAMKEFDECRIIDPLSGNVQFRAGEVYDRMGNPAVKTVSYMERAMQATPLEDPADWYALVVILKSRGGRTLSVDEVAEIKYNWLFVEYMTGAAGAGRLRMVTTFHEVDNEESRGFTKYGGKAFGPTPDIIGRRGWFDGVFCIRPRLEGETDAAPATVGGDAGPHGAAVSSLYHDADWTLLLQAWVEQYLWAARVGETGLGALTVPDLLDCGHPPAPHAGYALRAALRHYFPPDFRNRAKITDQPLPGSFLRLWKLEGPYPVEPRPADENPDKPSRPVVHSVPHGSAPRSLFVDSDADFIDLAEAFSHSGPALARATCWVYSPEDRHVRMWLGQNDAVAVSVNGRWIRQGYYVARGEYADRNVPDTVASYAPLRRGWNEFVVLCEGLGPPRDGGWGFSLRLATWKNQHVPGLAFVNQRPESDLVAPYAPPRVGPYYTWLDVRDRYPDLLPALTNTDLQTITGVGSVQIVSEFADGGGFVALMAPGASESRTYRKPPPQWRPDSEQDVVLNNVLDWSREAVAAFHYVKEGKPRALLLIKPIALEAYLLLLQESAEKTQFGSLVPAQRLLGYLDLRNGDCTRFVLVIDAALGEPANWPVDEEDLLSPHGDFIPNRLIIKRRATTRPAGP